VLYIAGGIILQWRDTKTVATLRCLNNGGKYVEKLCAVCTCTVDGISSTYSDSLLQTSFLSVLWLWHLYLYFRHGIG
jgi:hypothetical protein